MSILEYNGGAVVAMTGLNCVAIATDLRFGIQAQTLAMDFPKVFKITDHCFVGLPGLTTDTQTVLNKLRFRVNMYQLDEEREMKPRVLSSLISTMLYERRFGPYFVEPVVAGLEGEDGKPYICAMDLIGAPVYAEDFVLAGTASESLYGMCETVWRPNMNPEELFEAISQCLLSAVERSAFSGWGAQVYILTKDQIISRKLKCRMD